MTGMPATPSTAPVASSVAGSRPRKRRQPPPPTALDGESRHPRTEVVDVLAETLWTMLVSGGHRGLPPGRAPRTIDSPQRGRAGAGNGDPARPLELLGAAEDASIRTGRAR